MKLGSIKKLVFHEGVIETEISGDILHDLREGRLTQVAGMAVMIRQFRSFFLADILLKETIRIAVDNDTEEIGDNHFSVHGYILRVQAMKAKSVSFCQEKRYTNDTMKNNRMPEVLISKADHTTTDDSEELAFIDYQENVTRSKEAKRNRIILIVLSVVVYLLGIGLFATIVQTVYQMNHLAGMITGLVLLVLYTICFIIVVVEIFSRHSFDIEYRRLQKGHYSERTNNKVRWEIASNIAAQSSVLDYLDRQEKKEYLSAAELQKVNAFENVISLVQQNNGHTPSIHSKDSTNLALSLSIVMKKDGVIYKKAKGIILKRAIATGSLTALSQNPYMDAGVVVVKNLQLIKDLIWLYGFRPTNAEMNKIMGRVIRNVCIAIGLNTLPSNSRWAGKMFRDSNNFWAQLLGQALDMGAQFLGNGAMTYMVGKYTVNALMREYRIQEIFRVKDLSAYEMEMTSANIHELNDEIKEEVKQMGNRPEEHSVLAEQQKEIKALSEGKEKDHLWFDIFHWFDKNEPENAKTKTER